MPLTSAVTPRSPVRTVGRGLFVRHALTAACAIWWLGCATGASAQPLWFVDGKPTQAARQAVTALADAAAEGLDARDYDAESLGRAVTQAAGGPALAPEAVDHLDGALTESMRHYLSDLHRGRVDPRKVHAAFDMAKEKPFDADAYLRNALTANRLPDAIREAAPAFPLYGTLRDALARYRTLAAGPLWASALPAPPGGKLTPGQPYSALPQLAQRLAALGDLPAPAPGARPPTAYKDALVAAVKTFQARHGMTADGVIGAATLAQLNTAPADRVRQIALTMERMRWTPLAEGPRMIVVNVPEFVLRAYDFRDGKLDIKLEMKVIVGKALDTRTPLFEEDMRYIEFSPYWNVPPSIARAELVPRFRRDPGYFTRQGFEFVSGTTAVPTLSEANLGAVLNGKMRIRQRPGPLNALGDIKFVFPNNQNIYLHHTPSPQLFKRDRRDFSHGCIRVEAPVELAKFVLQDMPGWNEARIRQAMTKGASNTVALQAPLPVVLAYGTVIARADGRVYFLADIYGQDKVLDQALRQRTARRDSPAGPAADISAGTRPAAAEPRP